MTLPPDIERYVERRFAAADRAEVLELVGAAVTEDGHPAGPRLLRCALVAGAGDLGRLRGWIEHLKIDYRDVIFAAEYVQKGADWVQIRDLNRPLPDDA